MRTAHFERSGFCIATAALLMLMLGLVSTPLEGQSFTASLQGNIVDSSGGSVLGAQLTLVNDATNVRQVRQSDERGSYVFTPLPPGAYTLTVEKPGFQTAVRSGLQLQVQQQASVDITLNVGDVATSVVVAGESPRLDLVNATLGRVVDSTRLLNMPLSDRNTLALVFLTPGVVGNLNWTGSNFSSNGARNSTSDVLIDGVSVAVQEQNGGATDIKIRLAVEAVQEFKVQTNSLSAEYGFTGGAVVNMVTRSGTNEFRGSLYYFLRNSALNANDFFANRNGIPLSPLHHNQYGGTFGGPVWIPGMYKGRDKTFFFFHTEHTNDSNQLTTTETEPSLLQRQGNFSQTLDAKGGLVKIFDPLAVSKDGAGNYVRNPFPGNIIPPTRIDPVAAAVTKFWPNPNRPGNQFTQLNNFFNSGGLRFKAYQMTSKIDHNISETKRLSGRYTRVGQSTKAPYFWGGLESNPFESSGGWSWLNYTNNVTLDYVQTISPTMVLDVRAGIARQYGHSYPACKDCVYDPKIFGFTSPVNSVLPPQFSPQGYQSVGASRFQQINRGEGVVHLVANLTKIVGRHTIKFGGESRFYHLNYGQPGVNASSFNFSRQNTMQSPFVADSTQGDGFASFLLGWGTGQNDTDQSSAWAYQSYAGFYQHDIKLTPRLIVNLGVRYELPIPSTERYNRTNWFDTSAKSPLKTPAFPNLQGGYVFGNSDQRRHFDTDKNNVSPRFGFAYQFAPKMVVRGGYGIYYGITAAQISSGLGTGFRTNTPWNLSLDGGVTQYSFLGNPFPNGVNPPPGNSQGLLTAVGLAANLAAVRSWSTTPYYQQYNLSIERELPFNSVVEIAYSGSRGVHLNYSGMGALNRIDPQYYGRGNALNDVVPNPFYGVITNASSALSQPTVTAIQLLRPYPQFISVSGAPAGPPIGNSTYNAIQVKYTKRFSHDLTFSGHYTFAKAIDDVSSNLGFLGGSTPLQSYANTRLERSTSSWDIAHRALFDFTYNLPFGKGKTMGHNWNRLTDTILGGWQVNAIITLQSGAPLIPNLANGVLPDATQRPNLLFNPSLSGRPEDRLNAFVNASAFSRPAPYRLGNAPRTIPQARDQGLKNEDVSLFKNIYLSGDQKRSLQLRAEAFNIQNKPIFSPPNLTVGGTSFGIITSVANQPRQLQVAMKLYF